MGHLASVLCVGGYFASWSSGSAAPLRTSLSTSLLSNMGDCGSKPQYDGPSLGSYEDRSAIRNMPNSNSRAPEDVSSPLGPNYGCAKRGARDLDDTLCY